MNLSDYIKQKEKDTGLSHRKFLSRFNKMQKRPNTLINRFLSVRGVNYQIQKRWPFNRLWHYAKLKSGEIIPGPLMINDINKVNKIPKEQLVDLIKKDFMVNVCTIFHIDVIKFKRIYGKEISNKIDKVNTPKSLKKQRTNFNKNFSKDIKTIRNTVIALLIILAIIVAHYFKFF